MKTYFIFIGIVVLMFCTTLLAKAQPAIVPGAYQLKDYLPLIANKRVGIFANQTSMIEQVHLVDSLQALGINIKIIFGPEHGFRGTADAGEKVGNSIDTKTKIPIVSLYGSKQKPSSEDCKNIDVLLFDIQDVGVRFYTFISSLQGLMEAAFENNIPLIILDRPNPNGHYIDGPILEKKFKSFVGMQPVPIVYGMTIGEYAWMLAEEKWLGDSANEAYAKNKETHTLPPLLKIIPCANYTHKSVYTLPVKPSPNLATIQSIYWYPSTCFFEGTVLSEGRGTNKPFQIFGHPSLPNHLFAFTPNPNEAAKNSKLYGQPCYGWDISGTPEAVRQQVNNRIQLKWLLEAYRLFPRKDSFFLIPKSLSTGSSSKSTVTEAAYFFNKLAGNALLMQQIKAGKTEWQIRKTWQPGLQKFKLIRKKYLLYADVE
jgi:uncharacterized protein YbbC (DUF1343 family)